MNYLILMISLAIFTIGCTPVEGESPIPDIGTGTTGPSDGGGNDGGGPPDGGETNPPAETQSLYKPIGIGGGGAMSGVAISPYSNLWFVGTDMGTLFRSTDLGKSWIPVNHLQAVFHSELTRAVSPGFSSDGKTVFHASQGINPQISHDSGITFSKIKTLELSENEYIKYWLGHSLDQNIIFAGTNKGLFRSGDKGTSWIRISAFSTQAIGTFIDYQTQTYYHASSTGIWKSTDSGFSFSKVFTPSTSIRQFTGGRDASGLTLAYGDNDGINACLWAKSDLDTTSSCGYAWVAKSDLNFTRTTQIVGDHLKMAENDSKTIYATGGKKWIKQYGTKIHISSDAGSNWDLKLQQLNWDVVPFAPWPRDKLEYSGVALDIGWWDDGYESFEVNRRNSKVAAGSGYFFVHSTLNKGENWLAPFTEYKDTGVATAGKKWQTRGIEVTSIYRMKYHPRNSKLLYGASADIGGVISEDGGKSFRISAARYNSNYDYAFDPSDDNIVFAASGNEHDWPNDWHANPTKSAGGIFKSVNRGKTWTRLTPGGENDDLNRQFLSVAYDATRNIIYGGTQQTGIVRSLDNGVTWNYLNQGLPTSDKVIPQIEVDPNTGNAYALLTGNAPTFSNQKETGIYFLKSGSSIWQILRGNIQYPPDADLGYNLWYYPTAFAIDFDDPKTIWMVDYENKHNWLMTGVWKSTDEGANWKRVHQLTHATDIKIDPTDSTRVHASGYYTLDGSWGNGGQFYSSNGGKTWNKNKSPPLQQNSRSSIINPQDPTKLIYSYFGGGMLQGPNPSYL